MIFAEDVPHASECRCSGCNPMQPTIWALYSAMLEADEPAALLAMKAEEDPDLFSDPFIALELEIAAVLATAYGVKALEAKRILEKALTPPLNPREIDLALEEAGALLGDVFDEEVETRIRYLLNRTLIRGALIADGVEPGDIEEVEPDIPEPAKPLSESDEGLTSLEIGAAVIAGAAIGAATGIGWGTSLFQVPSALAVHEGIIAATKYYTNEHFNRIIVPEIQARVQLILAGADPADVPGFADINAYLSRRLQNVPYWRIVANGAASRAYHYGVMKAGALRQYRAYQLVAVLDDRTSEICKELDGTTFFLNDSVDLMEKAAAATDPEALKDLLPWVPGVDAIKGKSADELRDLGYVVPPFHPNCRTTIRFI